MATAHQTSQSILPEVQRQEKELLAKRQAAQDEARRIVDQARNDAVKHIQDEEQRAIDEIAASRREADQARRHEYDAAVRSVEEQLRGRREAAMGRVSEMAQQVMDFFLPKGSQA